MKSILNSIVLASLMMSAQPVLAASSSFVSKQANQSGGYLYTFRYFCASSAQGTFTLDAKTDEEAKKLADAKAKRVCEE